ncbi:MAG: hypothetical protein Q7I99_06100, partial [Acholeplasmataceae bacterium]|nr:hypothetical protein [Acholeplasmataceae bacterium]
MFKFPEQFIFKISEYIDIAVDWILTNMRGLFDVIRLLILNIFDGVEVTLSVIPWFVYVIALLIIGWKLYSL